MNKGSGINHFISQVGVSDLLQVFYTFESGGVTIPSVSGGIDIYSGLINGNINDFWSKPGSGFFSGNSVSILQTGMGQDYFTNLLSFELIKTGKHLLIDTLQNGSGYQIGVNDAHKLYFRSKDNDVDVYFTANFNLSSKNLISVGYLTNYVELGYYNFNSQTLEIESINASFGSTKNNDKFVIGSGLNGFVDYFLNFNLLISKTNLEKVCSGFCYIPTGLLRESGVICTNRITGYENIPFFKTGFVSCSGEILHADGIGDFSGSFPESSVVNRVTGVIESGYRQEPVFEVDCVSFLESESFLYESLTGYAMSFGMDKILMTNYIDSSDLCGFRVDRTPFYNFYNKPLSLVGSGFYTEDANGAENGLITLNGQCILDSGILKSNNFFISNLFSIGDDAFFDAALGSKKYFLNSITGIDIFYSGQQIFLNGVELISGLGFQSIGTKIFTVGEFSQVSGIVSERPIILPLVTGNNPFYSGDKFSRGSSIVFLNGVRQKNNYNYIEGSKFDLIKDNKFNENNNEVLYNRDGLFWE